MITQYTCPTCNKRTDVLSETPILDTMISRKLKCGHNEIVRKLTSTTNTNGKLFAPPEYCKKHKQNCITKLFNGEEFSSLRGEHLMPFQADGIEFAFHSNGRVGIFDEMGLGKTVQDLVTVRLNKEQMLPMIVICKAIAKIQWMKHTLYWLEEFSQVVTTTTEMWHEKYPIHIVSYETLRIAAKNENHSCHKIFERCKTVSIDECHLMKNDGAQRTKAVKKLCDGVDHIIALSGTPFKNQGGELFSILNTLRPDRFHQKEQFLYKYWDVYRDGFGFRVGGLKYPEKFKADTQDFLIRRTMSEVLPELPPVRRNNIFVELGEKVQEIYDKKYKEFCEFYEREEGKMGGFEFAQNILSYLNMMRHITGMAKVDAGVDFIDEFLMSTERKIVIFIHHHKVAELFIKKVNDSIKLIGGIDECATLTSKDKDSAERIVEEFRTNVRRRVLIASTLASGESINLQFCSDCILAERQWNPANEEQAGSGRFKRIGQKNTVNFNYLIAVGTIDEYFTDLVEKKRAIFDQVMDGKECNWDETNIVKELAKILVEKGKQKWSL